MSEAVSQLLLISNTLCMIQSALGLLSGLRACGWQDHKLLRALLLHHALLRLPMIHHVLRLHPSQLCASSTGSMCFSPVALMAACVLVVVSGQHG
jgi:hypothetical protein